MDQGKLGWFDRSQYSCTKHFAPNDWLDQLEKRQIINSMMDAQLDVRGLVEDLTTSPLAPRKFGRNFFPPAGGSPDLHQGAVFSPPAAMIVDLANQCKGADDMALIPAPGAAHVPFVPCMVDLSQPTYDNVERSFRQWWNAARRVYTPYDNGNQTFDYALKARYRQWGILEFFDIKTWLAVSHPGYEITNIFLGRLGRAADKAGMPDVPRWARRMSYLIFGEIQGNIGNWRKNIHSAVATYTSWAYLSDLAAYIRSLEVAPR